MERQAIIRWPLKLALEGAEGAPRLYDLATDPTERVNLAAENHSEVSRLREELEATPRAAQSGEQPEEVPLDEGTLERPRSSGYVE